MERNHERRLYRLRSAGKGLVPFRVQLKDSDLFIMATYDLREQAFTSLLKARRFIEDWINVHPSFATSLIPLDTELECPAIVLKMYEAGKICGVGPMAAVAGAIAEFVGSDILSHAREVIVENGGDIFIKTERERVALIYAAESPFSEKLGIKVPAGSRFGICTSSGTVGPSLSFGKADAVVVVAKDATIADAAATAVGNMVRSPDDFENALNKAKQFPIEGVVLISGETFAAWGSIELVEI